MSSLEAERALGIAPRVMMFYNGPTPPPWVSGREVEHFETRGHTIDITLAFTDERLVAKRIRIVESATGKLISESSEGTDPYPFGTTLGGIYGVAR
jgi:hypothetical protein